MKLTNILALTAAVLTSATVASADVIVLGADPWCPYNCEPGSEAPGFMVEVAREALAPFGHEIDYVSVSWARGIRQAELGQINGIIGAVPEEAPELIFGPPIGTYTDTVVFRRGEAIDLDQIGAQSNLRIGAINGYEYYGQVAEYIAANADDRTIVQYASGDDALEQNLRKLVAGRLDMVAEVRAVLDYTVLSLGLEGQLDIVDTDDASDVYIAFSPALETSALYVEQLREGIEMLRESGRYAAIFEKYGQDSGVQAD